MPRAQWLNTFLTYVNVPLKKVTNRHPGKRYVKIKLIPFTKIGEHVTIIFVSYIYVIRYVHASRKGVQRTNTGCKFSIDVQHCIRMHYTLSVNLSVNIPRGY